MTQDITMAKLAIIMPCTPPKVNLIPRPCVFGMKFAQKAWAHSSHDICESVFSESVQTLFFDESTGHTRKIWSGDETR